MDKDKQVIFNSPIDVALRLVFIIGKTSIPLDIHRLTYYSYLLVHSADIPNGPRSIHADLPKRSSEIAVNPKLIKRGLNLLISKGLITVNYSPKTGIEYFKNKNTIDFLGFFESKYSVLLSERADWLCKTFDYYTDEGLTDIMNKNVGIWGSEFLRE